MNEIKKLPDQFDLKELLTIDQVRANIAVEDWKEAADIIGELLVEAEKVEPEYVEKMKQALDDMGPYMVVAPGVALLHARPEDGVLEPCVALITLEEPVEFGHEENDPVDIVFAFGATDKESHIPALKTLAKQLKSKDVIKAIRSAQTDENLHEAFLTTHDE